MRNPTTPVTDALYEYILAHTVREDHLLDALLRETRNLPNAHWAATPEQVAFLTMLVRLTQALDIVLRAREEIIDAEHIGARGDQPLAKVRAQKPGPAGNDYAFSDMHPERPPNP